MKGILQKLVPGWVRALQGRHRLAAELVASGFGVLLSPTRGGAQEQSGQARSTEFTRLITTAIEAAANGILITDRQGIVQWVNPAFTQITGYSFQEMVGNTPRILKSGRQPPEFYKQMWETILAGRVWHGELYNRHKTGHTYVEEQTIAPLSDDTGEITHFIGVQQDITGRKRHEETLERRNAEVVVMAATIGNITSSLEVDGVLSSIVNSIRALLPQAIGATVQMEDAAGRLVTRAASTHLGPQGTPTVFEPGRGLAGLAHQTREIVNVGDVLEDARFLAGKVAPTYRSLIAVPIRSGSRALGVLSVESTERNAFQRHEERLLSLFAGSAAIAIRHAAEYEGRVQAEHELKRYSERLETMVEERTEALKAAQMQLLEQQRLEQEVVLAAQVQASILPHRIPQLPGYEFAAVALAARYVSGDLYDWIGLSPEHCYLAVADVAGKGVPAAMMTSTARALLRDGAARKNPPGRALSELNRSLYDDLTHAGMFITVVAADLDRKTAAVDYASAGHTEVLWYRASRRACERLPATGPPIGVLTEGAIEQRRILLCPGDVLVFYSDGVTETENEAAGFFGTDRLVEVVNANSSVPAATLARTIVDVVDAFGKGPRSDDLTIVVVRALPRTLPFRMPGDMAHLEEAVELLRTLGQAYGGTFADELELAASEIVTNVIEHAYRDRVGELRGEIRLEEDRIEIDLYDDGLSFDPSALPRKDLRQACERGYGVFIARQLLDEISYTPGTNGGNCWKMVKSRPRETPADGR